MLIVFTSIALPKNASEQIFVNVIQNLQTQWQCCQVHGFVCEIGLWSKVLRLIVSIYCINTETQNIFRYTALFTMHCKMLLCKYCYTSIKESQEFGV